MQWKSRRSRVPRLLGVIGLLVALAFVGVVPASGVDSSISNQAIYEEADSYTTGQGVGNCKEWVTMVFDAVAADAGSSLRIGPGMYSGFTDAGGIALPLSEAQQGDLVFVYNPSDPENYYYGMHAGFVVAALGDNVFSVIDANYALDGKIQRHDWDLDAYLDAYPDLTATVFRLGTVEEPASGLVSVYRFYNVRNGSHFYTDSAGERDIVISRWPNVYTYEGVAYVLNPASNTQPLYRFYNHVTGGHFYTASIDERDAVMEKWPTVFTYEGETYKVSLTEAASSLPVYRFYNVVNGSHFYTASEEERDIVISRWPNVYTYEGVAFYLGQ
ncbi:MAG: hypothetical protein AB2L09_00295 [Coriobacteriia bacterium]